MEQVQESNESTYAWALLICISLLFLILWMSYFLQRNRIWIVHETVISIFLGLIVGLIIRLSPDKGIQEIISFDHRYFFNLLLPPIILNSGYDLNQRNFFRNFGSILAFALIGTMMSTIIIGVFTMIFVWTGIHSLQLSFLDCVLFGAIMSSTDPVTILSIFHQLRVDPQLYALIFGESVLNDSVAIVLAATLGRFRGQEISVSTIIHGVNTFLGSFFGSTLIGIIIALLGAIMLKHTHLYEYPTLESCLISLLAFSSYLLSNGIQLSGIVSLLFCGITMRHYCYDNLSVRSKRTTKYMFRVLSQMSENFVFIYLGITLFTGEDLKFYPVLIFYSLFLILFARYFSVIPLAQAINWLNVRLYQRTEVIPRNHQLMIWWAGLRGAIAFALSFEVKGPSQQAVQSTVLITCVLSILALGGTTPLALRKLDIKLGGIRHKQDQHKLDEETDSSCSEEDGDTEFAVERVDEMTHWFMSFDDRYVRPMFTRIKEESIELPYNLSRASSPGEYNGESKRLVRPSGRIFGTTLE